MTDAEKTVDHAILHAISDTWHENNPIKTKLEVKKRITQPHLIWALKDYIIEIESEWEREALGKLREQELIHINDTH